MFKKELGKTNKIRVKMTWWKWINNYILIKSNTIFLYKTTSEDLKWEKIIRVIFVLYWDNYLRKCLFPNWFLQ